MTATDRDALRAWLLAKVSGGTLTLDAALAPEAGAVAAALGVSSVALTGVTVAAGDALVTGGAVVLGHAVTATVLGDRAPGLWLALSVPWPAGATFCGLFGPTADWWATTAGPGSYGPQRSFLDDLVLADCNLVVRSSADPEGGLAAGINLTGSFTPATSFAGGMLTGALEFAAAGKQIVHGAVTLAGGTTDAPIPAQLDLRVALPGLPFTLSTLPPVTPFLWLRSRYDASVPVGDSVVSLAVSTRLGSPDPIDLVLAAGLDIGAGAASLELASDGTATLGNGLADLEQLLGLAHGTLALPSGVGGLDQLSLDDLQLGFSLAPFGLRSIFVSVGLAPGTTWSLPVGGLAVTGLGTAWTWLALPAASGSAPTMPALSGVITGQLAVGRDRDLVVDIVVELPEVLVMGSLTSTVPLARLLPDELAGVSTAVPQLAHATLSHLLVAVAAGDAPSLAFTIVIDDVWTGTLGSLTSFSLTGLIGSMQYASAAGWSFAAAGTAQLGGVDVQLTWVYGPSFSLTAALDHVEVGALVAGLTDQHFTIPTWADFTLDTVTLAITEASRGWTLALSATIAGWGSGFVALVDVGTGWGFAVGVDITAFSRLGDAPGLGFLSELGLTIEDLVVIVNSVELATGYTLPIPANGTGTPVRVPSGVGAPQPGASFYGSFRFGDPAATSNALLRKLYGFLGLTADSALSLQLAATLSDGADGLTAAVLVGAELGADGQPTTGGGVQPATCHGLELAVYFGAQVGSTTELFLRGLLTLPIGEPEQRPRFGVELDLEPEGIVGSGSMLGPWPSPLGLTGLTISDAALELGCDWDLIPTVGFAGELSFGRFDGSAALLLNTENPAQSVVAASINQLALGDLARVLIPDAADVIEPGVLTVLDSIGLFGIPIGTATATPALVTALDTGDLATVAAGLGPAGLTLSPSRVDTLLVTGQAGQRWYLTDRRPAAPRGVPCHYQLVLADGQLALTLDPQLYVAPQAVTIGQLSYPFGIAGFARLDLHGWKADLSLAVGASTSFIPVAVTVEARLDKVSWFGGALTIARASDDRFAEPGLGPYLSIATATTTAPDGTSVPPHVAVSGAVTVLGLELASAAILVEPTGLHADLSTALGAGQLTIDWTLSPLALSGTGSASVTLSFDLDLSRFGLGTYHVAGVALTAALHLDFSSTKATGSASGSFSLDILGLGHLGPYQVSVTLDASHGLDQLEQWLSAAARAVVKLADDVGTLIKSSADAFVALVKAGTITLTRSLADVLEDVWGITSGDTAVTGCFAHRMVATAARVRAQQAPPGDPIDALPEGQLEALRTMRADLGGSAMGRWLLDIYDHISQPLVDVYDANPSIVIDGTTYSFQDLIATYHGQAAFGSLIAVLQTGGSFPTDGELITNLQYLIQGVLTFEPAGVIALGINALLGQLGLLNGYIQQGLDYQQMIAQLPSVVPPPSPFATSAAPRLGAPRASGPTPFEAFLTPILEQLVSEVPAWVRDGFSAGGVVVPPMTSVAVADQRGIDLGQPLALCPLFSTQPLGSTTTIDLVDGNVTGLDTLAKGGAIDYPVPDLQIVIPLQLASLALHTAWTTHSQCCHGGGAPAPVAHSGTLVAPFADVGLTIAVTLSAPTDQTLPQVTSLALAIVDDAHWRSQPIIDPACDLTVDASVPPPMRAVIAAGLGGGVVGPLLRARAQAVVSDPKLAAGIAAKVNAAIDSFAG